MLEQGGDICAICGWAGPLLKAGRLPTHRTPPCEGTKQDSEQVRSLHPDGWGTARWPWEDPTTVPFERRASTPHVDRLFAWAFGPGGTY